MSNAAILSFGELHLTEEAVKGKIILEVGSQNINGSPRAGVMCWQPASYIGVDIQQGAGVDEVCEASKLIERFGANYADVVICMELAEHVKDWRVMIHNLKAVLKLGGLLIFTTRSEGFLYHGFPFDFWRYEIEDLQVIFADFEIIQLVPDSMMVGALLAAKKPESWTAESQTPLENLQLFSILTGKREKECELQHFKAWFDQQVAQQYLSMARAMGWSDYEIVITGIPEIGNKETP